MDPLASLVSILGSTGPSTPDGVALLDVSVSRYPGRSHRFLPPHLVNAPLFLADGFGGGGPVLPAGSHLRAVGNMGRNLSSEGWGMVIYEVLDGPLSGSAVTVAEMNPNVCRFPDGNRLAAALVVRTDHPAIADAAIAEHCREFAEQVRSAE
jgi:hypothetical protein